MKFVRSFALSLLVAVASQTASGAPSVAWSATLRGDPVQYNSAALTDPSAQAMEVDAAGNSYVIGRVFTKAGFMTLTIKRDPQGVERWRAMATGQASATAVDASGNVYVVGQTTSPPIETLNPDFLTLKYDPNGVELWRAKAHGATDGGEIARAVAIDPSGNVYVTGIARDGGPSSILTIKYSSAGVEQWRAVATGTVDLDGTAIAVDGTGAVTVLGSAVSGFNSSYITIHYNARGREKWRATSIPAGSGNDSPRALGLDASGNAFVTGTSSGAALTIKYGSGGIEQWRATGASVSAFEPNAIAIDSGGAAFVAGGQASPVFGGVTFLTIKYAATGTELWRALDAANLNASQDGAHALVLDVHGNAYVTGSLGRTALTIKYAASGPEQWRTITSATGPLQSYAIGLDRAGNTYVSGDINGSSIFDFFTSKLDGTGQEVWRMTSGESATTTFPTSSLSVDASGNAYVAGTNFNGDDFDYLVAKYDPNGQELWRATFDGGGDDYATALGIDAAGNVYVTGSKVNFNDSPGYDCATLKYDTNGNELWRAHGSADPPFPLFLGGPMVVTPAGDVYVNCRSFIIHYDTNGTELWRAGTLGGGGFAAATMAVDLAGNVYAAGGLPDYAGGYAYVIAYDPNGIQQWSATIPGFSPAVSFWTAMAVDQSSNVFVGGSRAISYTTSEYLTLKYDKNGVEQWRAVGNVPNYPEGEANAIALDTAGNVLVSGAGFSTAGTGDILTIKYAPDGSEKWRAAVNGTGNGQDIAYGVATDAAGSAYVTGESYNGNNFDALTIKYSAAGAEQWRIRGTNPLDDDFAYAIALGPQGSVYLTGETIGPTTPIGVMLQKIVPGARSSTTLSSSRNPSFQGQAVTFTAQVNGVNATGSVDFRDGAIVLCAAAPVTTNSSGAKVAACTTAALVVGLHSISATYSGDSNNAGSVSPPLTQVVNLPPPGVTLTSSLNPSRSGDSVTFTAKVAGKAPTGTVTFKDGASTLCSAVPLQGGGNIPVATCSTAALAIGLHSITAIYSGDANNVGATSPVLTQTVKKTQQ